MVPRLVPGDVPFEDVAPHQGTTKASRLQAAKAVGRVKGVMALRVRPQRFIVATYSRLKHELSTGQATGQMANKRVHAFIFRKMPFLWGGISIVY